ncbi:uncharacterized protein LOC133728167 isoform X5 [Rosa rugosa]|uniref:uncharacterized protein LOC133728167 isoform X5 n=1 Tax=Rosa rugosa TaxID=74645 RepID=UPI002B407B51|nr:uncharacterized protein LOC133728167 isoform X5 [Rosa rugosa]
MAGPDASCVEEICQGDETVSKGVRNLAILFETLGASSPGTYTYTPVDFSSKFRGPVAGGGPSMDKAVLCNECSKEHPPYSYCPYAPCDICYKVHHPSYCPYFDHIPQGATFHHGYEIICGCGNEFNEDKWVCTSCGGSRAVLKAKRCKICNSVKQHGAYENARRTRFLLPSINWSETRGVQLCRIGFPITLFVFQNHHQERSMFQLLLLGGFVDT